MLKTKIDKNDVIDIINQIDPLINDGKYEDAVKLFAELDLSFGKLNESDKLMYIVKDDLIQDSFKNNPNSSYLRCQLCNKS